MENMSVDALPAGIFRVHQVFYFTNAFASAVTDSGI